MTQIKLTPNLAWGLVLLGGIVECFWASGLKYADSLLLYALTGILILISFFGMILAVRVLEVGIAYSVFVGIGTLGVTMAEVLFFGEPFSALKILFIITLLIGVVGLKLSADKIEESQGEKLAETLSHDLGIDEIVQDSKEYK
ncbi:multidrug efflux SMR transporter [Helicobacter mastomyrinus]|uniref:Multidrug efflux SMR transporter n=1 Tax=Helicobacter mastomyrinus TaxID=287948 RepID=A0ABZ3F8C1_9HELI